MRLVEGIRSKLLPVLPNLVERVVVEAVLLTALVEQPLQVVHLLNLLLAHRLAQGVALAAGEARQLPREQHHLLLIDRDAIGVLEVLLHAGEIVDNGLLALLAGDEVGDVVHGTRTVEGVHCDEVLERAGLQFNEILLHTCRLELEGTRRAAFTI